MTKNSRKLIYLMLIVLLTMSFSVANAAVGDTFEVGGLYFEVTSTSPATVEYYDTDDISDSLVVPATVTNPADSVDYAVTSILLRAGRGVNIGPYLTFEESAFPLDLYEETFENNPIDHVYLPKHIVSLGDDVFDLYNDMEDILIANDTIVFNSDPFDVDATPDVFCSEGSSAWTWANSHSLPMYAVVDLGSDRVGLMQGDTFDLVTEGYGFTVEYETSYYHTSAGLNTLTWESSNTDVATVDSNGVVTCVGGGDADITATLAGDLQGVMSVTVEALEITLDGTIEVDTGYPPADTDLFTDQITSDSVIEISGNTLPETQVELLMVYSTGSVHFFPRLLTLSDIDGDFTFTLDFNDPMVTPQLGEGAYDFSALVEYGVAEVESDSIHVVYDSTAPTPTVAFTDGAQTEVDYYNLSSTNLGFELLDFGSVHYYEYSTYEEGNLTPIEDGNVTLNIMPMNEYISLNPSSYSDGTITVKLYAWDAAGNRSDLLEDTIIKDTVAPGDAVFTIEEDYLNINDTELTLIVDKTVSSYMDEIPGVTYVYEVRNRNQAPVRDFVAGDSDDEELDGSVLVETSGLYSNQSGDIGVIVALVDAAGNQGDWTANDLGSLPKDMIAPSGYAVSFTDIFGNDIDYANNGVDTSDSDKVAANMVPFEVSGVEAGATVQYTVSDGSTSITNDLTPLPSFTPDINDTYHIDLTETGLDLADGTITITIDVTDEHGNEGETSDEDTLLKDTIAPVSTVAWEDEDYWNASATDPYTFEIGVTEANDYTLDINLTDEGGSAVVPDAGAGVYDVAWVDAVDGDVTVDVTAEDEAGNVSAMVFDTIVKDTVAPGLVDASIAESWLNLADQEITLTVDKDDPDYTAEMPDVTYVYEVRNITQPGPRDAIVGDNTDENLDGDILIDTTSLFSNQSGEIRVRVALIDAAGNQGDWKVVSVMKDMIAPGYIDSTIDEAWLNLADQELTLRVDKTDPDYTSETNVTYVWEARNQDQEVPRDVVAGDSSSEEMDGSVLIDTTPLNSNLSGEIGVRVALVDEAGNQGPWKWVFVNKDMIAPVVTVAWEDEDYWNVADGDRFTFTVTVDELNEYDLDVYVLDQGRNEVPFRMLDNGDGTYTCTLGTASAPEGYLAAFAVATDIAGNANEPAQDNIFKDTVTPVVTVAWEDEDYWNVADGDRFTFTVTVDELNEYDLDVYVLDQGRNEVPFRMLDNGDGTYTCTLGTASAPEGYLAAFAVATDIAGNANEPAQDNIFKDTVTPIVTVEWQDDKEYWNAAEGDRFTFTVTVEELNEYDLDIYVLDQGRNEVPFRMVDNEDGTYTCTLGTAQAPEGYLAAFAVATDVAGNANEPAQDNIFKDTVTPVVTVAWEDEDYWNVADGDRFTFTVTVDELNEYDLDVYVLDQGRNEVPFRMLDNEDGTYTCTLGTVQAPEGYLAAFAVATDVAGNANELAQDIIFKDTVTPVVTVSWEDEDYWNIADGDRFTFTVTVDELNEYDLDVYVLDQGRNEVPFRILDNEDGTYTCTLGTASAPEGYLAAFAVATDVAGNANEPAQDIIFKDTVAPVRYIALFDNDFVNLAGQEAVPFTVNTTGEVNYTYLATITDEAMNTVTTSESPVDLSGLDDGELTMTVVVTDEAGNAGPESMADTIVKDTVAPVRYIALFDNDFVNLAGQYAVPFTVNTTGEVNYTYLATITDEAMNTVTTSESPVDLSGLDDGELTMTVVVTDEAGNAGPESMADTIVKDTVAPVRYIALFDNDFVNLAGQYAVPFTVNTTGEVNYTYLATITDEAMNTVTTSVSPVDLSGLDDGELTITVVVTDEAGNAGPESMADTIVKDTVVPTIDTTLSNTSTYNSSITFTATADDLNLDSFDVSGASPTSNDDEYRASLSYGYNTITLTATDLAGNETVESYSVRRKTSSTGGYIPPVIVVPPVIIEPPVVEPEPECVIDLVLNENGAMVNGEMVELSTPPILDPVTSRTLVPLRFVSEVLGAEVNWNNELKQIQILYEGTEILLTINSTTVYVNGEAQVIDVAPQLIEFTAEDGTTFFVTYVPLRFVSETMGAEVIFDPVTKGITIKK